MSRQNGYRGHYIFNLSLTLGRDSIANGEQLLTFSENCNRPSVASAVVSGNAGDLRRREVVLAKISLYMVFVFLICHSVKIVPNIYEMVQTYLEVSQSPQSMSNYGICCTSICLFPTKNGFFFLKIILTN